MKKKTIIGIVLIVAGCALCGIEAAAALGGLSVIAGIVTLCIKSKKGLNKKPVKDQHTSTSNIIYRTASRSPVVISANKVMYPDKIEGYSLAYSYTDVQIYPPWEMISNLSFEMISESPELNFIPEPQNTYDENAVALYWHGNQIGYLLKNRLQEMTNAYIKKGWPVYAAFQSGKKDGSMSEVYISIAFYRPMK